MNDLFHFQAKRLPVLLSRMNPFHHTFSFEPKVISYYENGKKAHPRGVCQSDKDTPLHSFTFQKIKKFLFVNQKGKPKVAIDYNALFVRMVKKYNKQHKDNPLPHITPHTLRHTFCTRLASKNMNPKDLQYIMGHSNVSITMNWYAHASIDTAKSEVQRLIA